jgi:hypothetical protein
MHVNNKCILVLRIVCRDSPRCAVRSRALISQVGEHALVATGLPDLCSCATPVVPELGGRADEKTRRTGVDGLVPIHLPLPRQTLLLPTHLAS